MMIINSYRYVSGSSCPYAVVGSTYSLTGAFSTNISWAPAYGLFEYSMSASLYNTSDLGSTTKQLTGVQMYLSGYTTPYTFTSQEIWIGQVSNSTFPSTTPQVDFSDLTFTSSLVKVKSSFTLSITTNGVWYNIDFDTPYCWDNTNNLIFVWKNYKGTWSSGYGTSQAANVVSKGMYKGNTSGYPTGTGTRTNWPMLLRFNY